MSAVAYASELDVEDDYDFDPPSGVHRVCVPSIVVLEPTADLANALLEACDEPANVTRLFSLRPVPRRLVG
jgi:hypothetical protein